MKPFTSYSLLAALAACGLAFGEQATTTPVGYATVEINPGLFNLAGVTLQRPVVASGVIASANEDSVTAAANVDFSSLEEGVVYILEIKNGDGEGFLQEVQKPQGSVILTPEDISQHVVDNVTTFSLRPADTLNSVFGSNNEKMSLGESPDGSDGAADLVLIPKGDGTFDTYFFVRAPGVFEGWFDGSEPAGNAVVNYSDGVFIRTRPGSSAQNLVVSGEVKVSATAGVLMSGFNLVNSVAPAGLTLGSSGLASSLTASSDGGQAGADLVLIPNTQSPGTFKTYYYVNVPGVFQGWFDGSEPADDVKLEGGFFIRNFGSPKNYKLAAPTVAVN